MPQPLRVTSVPVVVDPVKHTSLDAVFDYEHVDTPHNIKDRNLKHHEASEDAYIETPIMLDLKSGPRYVAREAMTSPPSVADRVYGSFARKAEDRFANRFDNVDARLTAIEGRLGNLEANSQQILALLRTQQMFDLAEHPYYKGQAQ